MIKRREFIAASSALVATAATNASPLKVQAKSHMRHPKRPRALVQIHLAGGLDAILSTDPKETTEVDRRVDVPYGYADIAITNGPRGRYGPLVKTIFGDFAESLTFVNGIACSTVAHEVGTQQHIEMRRQVLGRRYPTYGMVLGSAINPDSAVYQVLFNYSPQLMHDDYFPLGRTLTISRQSIFLGKPEMRQLDLIDRVTRNTSEKNALVSAMEREFMRCGKTDACAPISSVKQLIMQWPDEPLPEPTVGGKPLSSVNFDSPMARTIASCAAFEIRDILFLLRHRLATTIHWRSLVGWDSHSDNLSRQQKCAGAAQFIGSFLQGLHSTSSIDGGRLSDEVLVVISSELGRFPMLNSWDGKDHLPELPMILYGPGVRKGVFGQTDELMRAVPISVATGKSSGSRQIKITLDDMAATILNIFGIEDTLSLGYPGRRLDFLLDA